MSSTSDSLTTSSSWVSRVLAIGLDCSSLLLLSRLDCILSGLFPVGLNGFFKSNGEGGTRNMALPVTKGRVENKTFGGSTFHDRLVRIKISTNQRVSSSSGERGRLSLKEVKVKPKKEQNEQTNKRLELWNRSF